MATKKAKAGKPASQLDIAESLFKALGWKPGIEAIEQAKKKPVSKRKPARKKPSTRSP